MLSSQCCSVMQSYRTRGQQVGRLLDIIPTRGAKAFPELIKALVNTQQEFLAELLDRDLAEQFKNLEASGEPEEVDSAPAVVEKSVLEKVSEIRMFLEIVIYFVYLLNLCIFIAYSYECYLIVYCY